MLLKACLCFCFFLSKGQVVNMPINNNFSSNTYSPANIVKNRVMALNISRCQNCISNEKNDTLKMYKKYFSLEGNEVKILVYKGKEANVNFTDSLVLIKGKTYRDIYTLKSNGSYKLISKYFDISDKEKIINDFAEIKKYKKMGCLNIKFIDSTFNTFYRYSLKDKKPKLDYAFESDSLYNVTMIKIYNNTRNEIDSISYIYNYPSLSGKSVLIKDKIKYLHSTITLNNSLQIVQENIFDAEYYKLDMKLATILEPSSSVIYHYTETGLISYIEYLYTENRRDVHFYTYEYYDK